MIFKNPCILNPALEGLKRNKCDLLYDPHVLLHPPGGVTDPVILKTDDESIGTKLASTYSLQIHTTYSSIPIMTFFFFFLE